MDVTLTSGDVCEVAGIPMNTLDRWVAGGLVGPVNASEGAGRHRRYSVAETLAVAAGALYRREGAGPDRVAGVVRLLAGIPLERLEAELNAGRTFPVPAALMDGAARAEDVALPAAWIPGRLIEPPLDDPETSPGAKALMRRLDLKALYADVRRKVADLSRRPAAKGRGRRRGLPGGAKKASKG